MELYDRVCETTTTTGTGNLTLAGAVTGFQSFSSAGAVSTGDDFHYLIEAVDSNGIPTGSWEVGIGKMTSSTTFVRTGVLSSSNAGSAVNFAAGTKRVHLIISAYQLGWRGALVVLSGNQTAKDFTTAAAIAWDTINIDTETTINLGNNLWAVGNPSRITLPAAGYNPTFVKLFGQVGISLATASEWIELKARLNGTTELCKHRFLMPGTSGTFQLYSQMIQLGPSDYVELMVQIQTDNSVTVVAADTFFELEMVQ